MYVTDGWGSFTSLMQLKWKISLENDPDTDHDFPYAVTRCGINNRGVALIDNKVVSHTLTED